MDEIFEWIESIGGSYVWESDMKVVGLTNSAVSDDDLRRISELNGMMILDLTGTTVSDAGISHIQNLSSLENLHVAGTNVTEAGVKSIEMAIPHIEVTTQQDNGNPFL